MIYNSFEVYLAGIRGLINLLFVPGHIVLAEWKSSCLALFILNFTIVYYSADVVAYIFLQNCYFLLYKPLILCTYTFIMAITVH